MLSPILKTTISLLRELGFDYFASCHERPKSYWLSRLYNDDYTLDVCTPDNTYLQISDTPHEPVIKVWQTGNRPWFPGGGTGRLIEINLCEPDSIERLTAIFLGQGIYSKIDQK
jgi:hypothetical protein